MANLKFYHGATAPQTPEVGMIWFNNVTETVEGVDLVKNLIKVCTGVVDGTATWEVYGTTDADLAALVSRVTTLETVTIPDLEQAIVDALAEAKDYADSLPHENTTYVISEGTENGKIKVTPSEGAAYEVPVHGLGTAAYHAEGDFVSSTGYVAYSQAEKDKLAGIEEGAEVNIIEEVQVNGVALEVSTDGKRAVNVVIPDATVKSVKEGDKVLKLEGTELSTELSLVYETQGEGDAAKKYIILKGLNGVEIAKIDASDFIADSFLNDVTLDADDNLQFTWTMADGSTKTDTVNIAKYIDTYTAGDGIDITDKEVSVKIDDTSDEFLTVGPDGVKLSGVQDAIDAAEIAAQKYTDDVIAALDSDVTSAEKYTVEVTDAEGAVSTEEVNHKVRVQVIEEDGIVTDVVVTESDIASAAALATLDAEVQEHEVVVSAALNDLNARVDGHATRLDELEAGLGAVEHTTVSDGDATDFVTISETTEGSHKNYAVSATVVKGANGDDAGLATDAYVREQVAQVAATADTAVQTVVSDNECLTATKEGTQVELSLCWMSF